MQAIDDTFKALTFLNLVDHQHILDAIPGLCQNIFIQRMVLKQFLVLQTRQVNENDIYAIFRRQLIPIGFQELGFTRPTNAGDNFDIWRPP